MKRWLTAALLLASSLAWGAVDEGRYFDISDFHCGVDTYHSSLAINDCYVQDALNVYFDKDAPIVKRSGYTTFASSSSYAFIGLWSYTDTSSNVWMIARSSDAIMATTEVGTSLFTVRIATVSSSNIVNSVNAFGNAYFVDQTQGVYYWNGTSTTYVSGSPKGSLIAQFHNRVWISGLASPNGNYVYGSKYLDGTVWATGINASDPVLLQVALNDSFDVVTALWAGYNDIMYIFKNYSIHGLYGFDQTDFQVRALNGEVGCIDQRSIQFFLGGLVFASARGIESFDGYTATRISDSIKTKVDPITLNSSFNQNSWTQSSQTDWQAGTFNSNGPTTSLSATISSPNLVLSTGVASDTTLATPNNVTIGIDTTTASTIFTLKNIAEPLSNITNWTTTNGTYITSGGSLDCTASPCNMKYTARNMANAGDFILQFELNAQSTCNNVSYGGGVFDASNHGNGFYIRDNGLGTSLVFYAGSNCTWSDTGGGFQCTGDGAGVAVSGCNSNWHTVKVVHVNSTGATSIFFDGSLTDTHTNSTYQQPFETVKVGNDEAIGIAHPLIRNLYYTATTGNFTSRSFDTGFFSPAYNQFNATINSNGTYSFAVKSSASSSSGFTADVGASTGTVISGLAKNRYIIYSATLTASTAGSVPQVTNPQIDFVASTGTWASQVHNISTATAFGNFNANSTITGAASIIYNVCSSASSTMANKTCVITPANANIAVSTNIYVQVLASATVTAATETATLQSFTANWYTGTRKPSMASTVYDNRYWLSVTTDTSDSYNDATLVLSAGPLWSIFDIRAGSFVIWKNAFYFGNSFSSGYVYQLEQGSNDNGSAINAYIKTKDYAPGGLTSDKFFGKIHLVADNLGAYNIYTNYYIDRTTTSFSLGNIIQNETPGTLITKLQIPVDSTHQNFGKTISFKFQQNDVNAPWKFYGATLRYKSRRPL